MTKVFTPLNQCKYYSPRLVAQVGGTWHNYHFCIARVLLTDKENVARHISENRIENIISTLSASAVSFRPAVAAKYIPYAVYFHCAPTYWQICYAFQNATIYFKISTCAASELIANALWFTDGNEVETAEKPMKAGIISCYPPELPSGCCVMKLLLTNKGKVFIPPADECSIPGKFTCTHYLILVCTRCSASQER